MMIIMQFTFQIILLAVGFGVGYWLLLIANGQQQESLKNIGQGLGGILIVMAMILALLSCYYLMKIATSDYMQGDCPEQEKQMLRDGDRAETDTTDKREQMQQNKNVPLINKGEYETQDELPEEEGQPIKSNIKDHE